MNDSTLKYLEIGAANADKCVIWLHGLGADGHDFEPIVPELKLPDNHGIRFIFPHAPQRPVTINAGAVMPAWYDVTSMDFSNHENEQDIKTSADQISQLIQAQLQMGIDSKKIVLAGFSQGGAIALYTGLHFSQPLAGIIALSTYLPLVKNLETEISDANCHIPIMMCHGTHDSVVPFHLGDDSRYFMEQVGLKIDWHSYPMQHSVCADEIIDISLWLQKILL